MQRNQTPTSVRELFFSFEGCVNRARYWIYSIVILNFILLLAMMIGHVVGGEDGMEDGYLVGLLLIVWPTLALNVKRCHDRGRSGLFVLVGMIPLVNIWYLIEVLFLPSAKMEETFTSLNLTRTRPVS